MKDSVLEFRDTAMTSNWLEGNLKDYNDSRGLSKFSLQTHEKGYSQLRREDSFDGGTNSITDCASLFSGISDDSELKRSPLGTVVKKCAQELQRKPPLSERRTQIMLHSLLEVVSGNMKNAGIAIENGAVPATIAVMKNHKDSVKLQSRAILLLGSFGEDIQGKDAVASHYGIGYILVAMDRNSKSSNLWRDSCSALCKLTNGSTRNSCQLAYGDGVKILHRGMKNFIKDNSIQFNSLATLFYVAQSEVSCVADPEVIETAILSMTTHKKVKAITQIGCSLINFLSMNGDSRAKSSLVWSNALSVILKAMKHLPCCGVVQREGCEALSSLVQERPEARVFIAEEGLSQILDAMVTQPSCVSIQKSVCDILNVLSDENISSVKLLKNYNNYKAALEFAKTTYPVECGASVDAVLKTI